MVLKNLNTLVDKKNLKLSFLFFVAFSCFLMSSSVQAELDAKTQIARLHSLEQDLLVAESEDFYFEVLEVSSSLKITLSKINRLHSMSDSDLLSSVSALVKLEQLASMQELRLINLFQKKRSELRAIDSLSDEDQQLLEVIEKYFPDLEEDSEEAKELKGKVWFLTKDIKIEIGQSTVDRVERAAADLKRESGVATDKLSDLAQDLGEKIEEWADSVEEEYDEAKGEYDQSQLKDYLQDIEKDIAQIGRNIEAEAQRLEPKRKEFEANIKREADVAAQKVREAGRSARKKINKALGVKW